MLYTTGQGVIDGMHAMFVDGFHFVPKPYTLDAFSKAITNISRVPGKANYPSAQIRP